MNRKLLGESLVEAGLINKEQLTHALGVKGQKFHLEKIGKTLMNLNYIDEDTLIEFLGRQWGTSGINLYKAKIDERAVHTLTKNIAEKYKAIPVGFNYHGRTKKLVVAISDPSNLEALDTINFISGYCVEPVFARDEDIRWAIQYHYYYHKRQVV